MSRRETFCILHGLPRIISTLLFDKLARSVGGDARSVVLTVGSIAMTNEGFQNERMHLLMGLLYIPLGLTTILFSSMTLKYHRVL